MRKDTKDRAQDCFFASVGARSRWIWGLLCALVSIAGLLAIVSATYPIFPAANAHAATPSPSASPTPTSTPMPEAAEPMTVYVCGTDQFYEIELTEGTVNDALRLSGVTYDSQDLISPSTHILLEDGMRIRITDVTVGKVTESQAIPYGSVEKDDPTVLIGLKKQKSPGKEGEKQLTYAVTYHNGVEVQRSLISERVVSEPVAEVISVGTLDDSYIEVAAQRSFKNDNRTQDELPLMSQVKEVVYYQATAYTHTGNKTSTGTWPEVGTIAVNPEQIPYGTKLYVEGYGYGIAADTGGFRHSGRKQIDLFMDTEKECINWGRRDGVRVFILK